MKKLKRGDFLPDEDHVMRHVPWQRLRKDGDGNVLGILAEAFALRPENPLRPAEESLSVNWLEYFEGTHAERATQCIQNLRVAKEIKKSSKCAFGIGKIGLIKEVGNKYKAPIRIVYAPTKPDNLSHSAIHKLHSDDLSLLDAIASEAFCELVHNVDIAE